MRQPITVLKSSHQRQGLPQTCQSSTMSATSQSSATRYTIHLLNNINSKARRLSQTPSRPITRKMSSIHGAGIEEVHDVPMSVVIRPILPEVDQAKVESLMKTLSNPKTADQVPPVDILWIEGRLGGDYYYSFGGCHRYVAHKQLNLPTIKAKIFKSTINDLKCYLGSSTPDLK